MTSEVLRHSPSLLFLLLSVMGGVGSGGRTEIGWSSSYTSYLILLPNSSSKSFRVGNAVGMSACVSVDELADGSVKKNGLRKKHIPTFSISFSFENHPQIKSLIPV